MVRKTVPVARYQRKQPKYFMKVIPVTQGEVFLRNTRRPWQASGVVG